MNSGHVRNPLARDLDLLVAGTAGIWESFRGERVFMTGGTGFVGSWLLESLLWANDSQDLGLRVIVLTRDVAGFAARSPHLAERPDVTLAQGDVRTFELPAHASRFVIHAAADTRASVVGAPDETTEVSVRGTERVLDHALKCGAEKVLYVSSGAVYDPGTDYRENATWRSPAANLYALGKRLAESACISWSRRHGIEVKIARCFSFLGPFLPTDRQFAAGNFIRDALAGGPVCAHRVGAIRSYMYASDMAAWLWTVLVRGRSRRAYNVGSDRRIATPDLARRVAEAAGVRVEFEGDADARPRLVGSEYVPNTERARRELFLTETVDLREGIRRTLAWHRRRSGGALVGAGAP